jgi:hypothetical protein
MIVQHFTWKVKVDTMEKTIELLKAEIAMMRPSHTWRLYTPNIGKFDVVIGEVEFENLAEQDKFWTDWFAKPEAREFFKKFNELIERGGGSEIWNLE